MPRFQDNDVIKRAATAPAVLENLTGTPGVSVTEFRALPQPKHGGGTQSKGYILVLSDGSEWFVKQTATRDDVQRQLDADLYIQEKLGAHADSSPYVKASYAVPIATNGIIIFPKADGKTLVSALQTKSEGFPRVHNPGMPKDAQMLAVRNLGRALATSHIASLKTSGQLQRFYDSGGDLTGLSVIVHPDLQFSNIIADESGNIKLVDTDSTGIVDANESYTNIKDILVFLPGYEMDYKKAWNTDEPCPWMQEFFAGYLAEFPADKQQMIFDQMRSQLLSKYKLSIAEYMVPEIPVKHMPQAEVRQEAKVAEVTPISPAIHVAGKKPKAPKEKDVSRSREEVKAAADALALEEARAREEASAREEARAREAAIAKRKTPAKEEREVKKPRVVELPKDEGLLSIKKSYKERKRIEGTHKLLYDLVDDADKRVFWKPAKNAHPGTEEGMEVSGAAIAHHITGGLVPEAHLREMDGQLGIGEEFVGLEYLKPGDARIDELSPDQVAQIIAHLLADKVISNYDCHFDQFGIDADGNVIGVDKGLAFRHFKRGNVGFNEKLHGISTDTDKIDLRLYGGDDINFYKVIMEKIKAGELQVDFENPIIAQALERCSKLSMDDVIRLYGPYADTRYKDDQTRKDKFFQQVFERAHAMPAEYAKFRVQYDPTKAHELEAMAPELEVEKPEALSNFDFTTLDDVAAAKERSIGLRERIAQGDAKADEELEAVYAQAHQDFVRVSGHLSQLEAQTKDLRGILEREDSILQRDLRECERNLENFKSMHDLLSGTARSKNQHSIEAEEARKALLENQIAELNNDPRQQMLGLLEQEMVKYTEERARRLQIKSDCEPDRIKHVLGKYKKTEAGVEKGRFGGKAAIAMKGVDYVKYLNLDQYYNLAQFFHQSTEGRQDPDFLQDAINVQKQDYPVDIVKRVTDFINLNDRLTYPVIMDIANGAIVRPDGEEYFQANQLSQEKLDDLRLRSGVSRESDDFYRAQQEVNKQLIALRNASKALEEKYNQCVEKGDDVSSFDISQLKTAVEKVGEASEHLSEILHDGKVFYVPEGTDTPLEFDAKKIVDSVVRGRQLEANIGQLDQATLLLGKLQVDAYEKEMAGLKEEFDEIIACDFEDVQPLKLAQLDRKAKALNNKKGQIEPSILAPATLEHFEAIEQQHDALVVEIAAYKERRTDYFANKEANKALVREQHEAFVREQVVAITKLDPENIFSKRQIDRLVNGVLDKCSNEEEIRAFLTEDRLLQLDSELQGGPGLGAGMPPPPPVPNIGADMHSPGVAETVNGEEPQPAEVAHTIEHQPSFDASRSEDVTKNDSFLRLQDISADVNKAYQDRRSSSGSYFLKKILPWSVNTERTKQIETLQNALASYTKNPASPDALKYLDATLGNLLLDLQKEHASQRLGKSGFETLVEDVKGDLETIKQMLRQERPNLKTMLSKKGGMG